MYSMMMDLIPDSLSEDDEFEVYSEFMSFRCSEKEWSA